MSKVSTVFCILNLFLVTAQNSALTGINESIFKMMYEAQYKFRKAKFEKVTRDFDVDWEKCDDEYVSPACCLWSEKRKFGRTTSRCVNIKGDVILENDIDAKYFQSLLDIQNIQGSLVLRNTTLIAFGLPELLKIGFSGPMSTNRTEATLIIENNVYLSRLKLRKIERIVKHESQKYIKISENPRLLIDVKQYGIFQRATSHSDDLNDFKPPTDRYVRSLWIELWPYFLFGVMIIIVFTHHFIMLEVNESRVMRKEQEMVECMSNMRDATLASELLIQTPSDVTLEFDKDVLHLCTDQAELKKQIEKLLNADLKAFKDTFLSEEFSAREDNFNF